MGSKSSNSSSSSFDPEKYGEWKEYKGKIDYIESDIKVNDLYWRDVPMITKGKEIGLNVARGFSLGFSEIGCEGKDISHDIIVVITNKGPNYVLEWLDRNMLRPGYYDKYYRKKYKKKYNYSPNNMKLSDLRSIMNSNPGEGDCKDHARLWWKIIKEKY